LRGDISTKLCVQIPPGPPFTGTLGWTCKRRTKIVAKNSSRNMGEEAPGKRVEHFFSAYAKLPGITKKE
jgi:hypothetical protein